MYTKSSYSESVRCNMDSYQLLFVYMSGSAQLCGLEGLEASHCRNVMTDRLQATKA